MVNCLICGNTFEDDKSLHGHIKAHELLVFEYYQKTTPRLDLYDGSMIAFKNKKQYFETDFNSARNMVLWLEEQNEDDKKKYLAGLLTKRKAEKDLAFSPTQIELRSLKMPGINYLNKVFGDYYSFAEQIGFKNRYSFVKGLILRDIFKLSSAKILIDSREQMPLPLDCQSEVTGLKFGDYSFYDTDKSGNCHIERKSLSDLIGTLSGGLERFEREIERAKDAGAYLVILVEDSLMNAVKFNTLDYIYKKGMKITPEYVFHNVRYLIQKHNNIQFLFVKSRDEASKMVKKIFSYGDQLKKIDIQYYYDIGTL